MTDVLDISHHNEVASWSAIRAAGIIGIIHKASEGNYNVDETYTSRRNEAMRAGLLWGAYHFMRPGSQQEQAEWFIKAAKPGPNDLICADYEDDEMDLNDLQAFLQAVEGLTGRKAVIYSGHLIKEGVGEKHIPWLADHQLWIAQYTDASQPEWPKATWPKYMLWQFTDTGAAPGVSGNVDCNSTQMSEQELRSAWSGGRAVPAPPVPDDPDKLVTVMVSVIAPPGITVRVVQS